MSGRWQYFAIHSLLSNPQMNDINVQHFVVFELELISESDNVLKTK